METVNKLNQLLIEYQMHYQNLRVFHWNVKGPMFFVLHAKFEEMYLIAAEKNDEIAERILALDGMPTGSLETILKLSEIDSASEALSANEMIESIVAANHVLIKNVNLVLTSAQEHDDEGTLDLFTSYISEIEKENWMLKAHLN